MVSSNFTTSSLATTSSEKNVSIGIITVLIVNAILAFSLLFIIFMRFMKTQRRLRPLFFFNATMLLLTLAQSIVSIIYQRDLMFYIHDLWLYTIQTVFTCTIKIIVELILLLRLRALYPGYNFFLAFCVVLVALRAFLETFVTLYGIQNKYEWMYTAEPFLEVAVIILFSSTFIITLIRQIYIRGTIKAFLQHRLFPFIVLAIENMIIPCITSTILAIYSFYVNDNLMIFYRVLILRIHIGVTVVSIIMTTILGSSSRIQHYTLEETSDKRTGRKDRQVRTLSMAPDVKVLMEAEHEEPGNEIEFSYLCTEGRNNC